MMARSLLSGTLAGAVSIVVFTIVHDLLISDIWFSLIPMLIAGMVCGLCVAWSYHLAFDQPTLGRWFLFNLVFTAMFVVLAPISLIVYEPVTTVAEVIAANEAPRDLIAIAMPLTILFTISTATVVGWLYGRSIAHRAVILLTTVVLVVTLGLNVSILGLVDIPSSALSQVLNLFLMIVAIVAVYSTVFALLRLRSASPRVDDGDVSSART